MWEIEAAKAADMPEIEDLIATVGGDRVDLATDQFVVAKSEDAWILGCGRLRPYPDFCEIASMAVVGDVRATGIGRAIVERLLKTYEGTIYLICDDDVVELSAALSLVCFLNPRCRMTSVPSGTISALPPGQ